MRATGCPANTTLYGGSSTGRECVAPFECVGGKRPDSSACECGTKRCGRCTWAAGNGAGEDVCLECKSKYWMLPDGSCPRRCPRDHRVTDENNIRRCIPPE